MNKRKVLIADDNRANQLIAGKFLNQLGVDTDYAVNGQEALDMVHSNDYQLVLMDLNMPVLSGTEACKQIRASEGDYFQNLPIIAVTSSFAEDVKKQLEEVGLTGFIPKPINPTSIKQMITTYLSDIEIESSSSADKKLVCSCEEEDFDCSRLFEITNGNINMVRDIIKTITEILPVEISVINEANNTSDYTVMKRSAHKIKPNYEYVGLNDLASIAERIEESAGKIRPEVLTGLITDLSRRTRDIVPLLSTCDLKQVH